MLALPWIFACISGIQAVSVYISPPRTYLKSTLSPGDASTALSRHLGLEAPFVYQEEFVAQGEKKALVVTLQRNDAHAILPASLALAFTVETPPVHDLSSVVSAYLHRAAHSFTSIFPARQLQSLQDVRALLSFFDTAEEPAFAAIDLSTLRLTQATEEIIHELRSFLTQISQDDSYNLAVLTYPTPSSSSSFAKRQENLESQSPLPSTAPPQLPIGAVSTCHATLDACNNGTTSCSGRGQCVQASKAGRTCFVCTCGVTKTGQGKDVKTDHWAGEQCERKDISSQFVLLSGTVVMIVLLVAGAISLLYTIGEQPLPSTLLATAVHTKKE